MQPITIKLYLDKDEATTSLKIRPHLTPRQVIALGQFGRQLMDVGVTRQEIEILLMLPEEAQPYAAFNLVTRALFGMALGDDIDAEPDALKAFYQLLQVFTGFDAATVRKLVNDDLIAIGAAIWEGAKVTEFGGFLHLTISSIFPPSKEADTQSTSEIPSPSPPAGEEAPAGSGSSSEAPSNPGGGTSNGGLTTSSDPSPEKPDGDSITSLTESATEPASNSASPSLVST